MPEEILGYIAIVFNLAGFLSRNLLNSLWLGAAAVFFYLLNLFVIAAPFPSIMIVFLGFSVTVISILLTIRGEDEIKREIIKWSIVPAVAIFLVLGMGLPNFIASLGFLLATVAKLQRDVMRMKQWFILSTITWLAFDFLIGCISCILFEIVGISSLTFTIFRLGGGLIF